MDIYTQEELQRLIEKVNKALVKLNIVKLNISEDFQETTSLECFVEILNFDKDENTIIHNFSCEGKGIADALYKGLIKEFSLEFDTLEDFEFSSFSLDIKKDKGEKTAKSDVPAIGKMVLFNKKNKKEFVFETTSYSVTSAVSELVTKSIEFFINAEKAVVLLLKAIKDAKKRNRPDLVESLTKQLSNLMIITSYEKTAKKQKNN